MKNQTDKRGLSPVIATVLLIAMVVVIGLIVFLWVRGFQSEAVTKFGGKNIQLVCQEVGFNTGYSASNGELTISNLENVAIYNIKAQIFQGRGYDSVNLNSKAGWPDQGLTQGKIVSIDMSSDFQDATKVNLVPVLIGKSDSGSQKTYVCGDQFGVEVSV